MKSIKVLVLSCLIGAGMSVMAQTTPTSQMEKLSRGLVVIPSNSGSGEFVSWRLLGTDNASTTTFDVIRNGTTIAKNLKNVTSYLDTGGSSSSKYQVAKRVNGVITETTDAVTPWSNVYKSLKLSRPKAGYSPNDCSVADVDGDGEYELIVKWDPSDSKDNSQSGKTNAVYIDCYEFTGTRLWRIDLGYNIRAGAHYTQFLVYDFDGDGKAELMCKTAPLSKDGKGNYVTAAATDSNIKNASQTNYRSSTGYILSGPEYLTVFNGQTGAAIHTVWYNPNRAGGYGAAADHPAKSFWGDNYGNRCDRYLACVAYLDGSSSTPSAVFCRGYYTRAYLWAVKFNGSTISTKWLSAHTSKNSVTVTNSSGSSTTKTYSTSTSGSGSATLYGNGNHNLSVADVDGDGKDEILYGSGAVDNDGSLLYATGFGHGDAIHVSDFAPDRSGLEVFQVHEESPYGWDLHDAATGKILYSSTGSSDNGRGIAGCFLSSARGGQMASSNDRQLRSCVNNSVLSTKSTSVNFRIYWDGSLYDQLFDKTITKTNGSSITTLFSPTNYNNSTTCNSTKATPCLQADIFGDWREEIIMWNSSDSCTINIFSTTETTSYRVPTLMHDHVYRMGVAWQNVAYNQPPHLGYYLPDYATSFNANSSIVAVDNTTMTGYVQWTYNGGTLSQSATYSGLSGYVTGSVSAGSGLTAGGTKTVGGLTETLLGVTSKTSSASSSNALTFKVTPASGYTFQATKVEVTATRFGTDGGKLDIKFGSTTLASGVTPCRNNTSPYYTTYTYNLSGSASSSAQSLLLYLYNLATNKQYGICNIKVYGTVKSASAASAKSAGTLVDEGDEVVTAIQEVQQTTPRQNDNAYYDMSGRRINAADLRPGTLYLHNGKKFIK
ncbi:MAG: rhamnogalacturonan lyase [Prevotella sp.]|nr:rhamnogalacturonan lyase [Prevotella sp.]